MAASTNYRVILGAKIRKVRKRAKLSQETVAERADLHPNYFGRVERGEESASVNALRAIAKALGVRMRELVWEI